MKKLYFLSLVFSLFVLGLFAQENSPKKFKIITGVNLGSQYLNVPQFKGNSAFTTNLHIAAFVDVPISGNLSIQPGVSFNGKGAKYDYSGTGVDPTYGPYNFTYKGTSNIMYLEVPLNGVYRIKNIYIGTGPYFAYALSGKKHAQSSCISSSCFFIDDKSYPEQYLRSSPVQFPSFLQ